MKRSDFLGTDMKSVELQLALKRAEYVDAMKQGQVFNDLKKIFLEIKDLQRTLQDLHEGATTINTEMRTAS
jgi:hypothetical protein